MEFSKTRWGWIIPVVVALLCAAGGYWFGRPARVVETAAPEVKLGDGSIIVERAPDAKEKPKQMLPKGSKLERVAHVEVQGAGLKQPDVTTKACPPVTIDSSLVRLDDGTKRLIISSPDGKITRAVDIPVETSAPTPEPPKWAAGVSIDPIHQAIGVWMERDVSRIRIGVEINQDRLGAFGGTRAMVRVGWKF